jgi:hypothetical protein
VEGLDSTGTNVGAGFKRCQQPRAKNTKALLTTHKTFLRHAPIPADSACCCMPADRQM